MFSASIDFERGQALGHGDRVAAEGVEVDAVFHHGGDFGPRHAGAERHAVADALGHRHQVGRDAPVLEAPEMLAGAAEAGLHFVGDAQAAVLADDVVDDLEIFRRRRDGSADALDRFADEAGDFARRFVADQIFDVVGAFDVAARDTRGRRGSDNNSRAWRA